MTHAQPIHVDESVAEEVRSYARQIGMDADRLASEALHAALARLRKYGLFEPRDPDHSTVEAQAILRRAGTEPPQPGDELPEGWEPIA